LDIQLARKRRHSHVRIEIGDFIFIRVSFK
jgi:hypothetical protein